MKVLTGKKNEIKKKRRNRLKRTKKKNTFYKHSFFLRNEAVVRFLQIVYFDCYASRKRIPGHAAPSLMILRFYLTLRSDNHNEKWSLPLF